MGGKVANPPRLATLLPMMRWEGIQVPGTCICIPFRAPKRTRHVSDEIRKSGMLMSVIVAKAHAVHGQFSKPSTSRITILNQMLEDKSLGLDIDLF